MNEERSGTNPSHPSAISTRLQLNWGGGEGGRAELNECLKSCLHVVHSTAYFHKLHLTEDSQCVKTAAGGDVHPPAAQPRSPFITTKNS